MGVITTSLRRAFHGAKDPVVDVPIAKAGGWQRSVPGSCRLLVRGSHRRAAKLKRPVELYVVQPTFARCLELLRRFLHRGHVRQNHALMLARRRGKAVRLLTRHPSSETTIAREPTPYRDLPSPSVLVSTSVDGRVALAPAPVPEGPTPNLLEQRGDEVNVGSKRVIRVSCCATRWPEPPPRPAPGWVEAPMFQSPSTVVAWRPEEASGRHRKLWSSSAEPPYGSPLTALGLRRCKSQGVKTSIMRTLSRRSGAGRATRSGTRLAYALASVSVHPCVV